MDHTVRVCFFNEKLPTVLQTVGTILLAFLPEMNESSCCSASSPAFGNVSTLALVILIGMVVEFNCFNEKFSNGICFDYMDLCQQTSV